MQGDVVLADWGICGCLPVAGGSAALRKGPEEGDEAGDPVSWSAPAGDASGTASGVGNSSPERTGAASSGDERPIGLRPEGDISPAVAFVQGAPMGTPFWAAPELDIGAPHNQ